MATSEQRKLIRRKIEAGASAQQVYDELHGPGNAADEALADLVRYVPTLDRRAEYRTAHLVLLGLLVLAIAATLGIAIPAATQKGLVGVVFKSVWCIGYLVVFVGVLKYWRRAHGIAGLLAVLQLFQANPNTHSDMDGMPTAVVILLGILAVMGFFLQRKLTTNYITVKEPYVNAEGQERLKQVVRFGD